MTAGLRFVCTQRDVWTGGFIITEIIMEFEFLFWELLLHYHKSQSSQKSDSGLLEGVHCSVRTRAVLGIVVGTPQERTWWEKSDSQQNMTWKMTVSGFA